MSTERTEPVATAPRTTRDRIVVAQRIAIVLVALGITFGSLWLALPIVRAWMLPVAPPGGWVLGPPIAFRFAACAVLSATTLPFVLRFVGRHWRAQDLAARGAPIDPLAAQPGAKLARTIQGVVLFVLYAIGGGFYFTSYVEVDSQHLVVHSLLGARDYRYERIRGLERQAPIGGQPERYAIRFDDDSWGYFSADQEGTTPEEIRDVAEHVARHASRDWIDTQRP